MTCLFSSGLITGILAQGDKPPTKGELARISRRGAQLAAYDVAAWHGTDAVMGLPADKAKMGQYIARHEGDGWVVVFGKLNGARDRFLIAYEAKQQGAPTRFSAIGHDPPREDAGFYLNAARAIQAAMTDIGPFQRPYNSVVLPEDDDTLAVYLVPAQTDAKIYPLGGDTCFSFSGDGMRLLAKRQLHRTVLDREVREGSEAGYHNHVLDNLPSETDVFHVLVRKPAIAEYVASRKYMYMIAPSGEITYLGETEKVLKK